ncbi:sperm microtubule associated protein 2-like [Corticium candelabrum]|uniref:sperm microtubule associated protein 2-like n=1 Tax=Corticium candelabrum TaxID=121492 RepID=UPI002E253BD0|nr:sperm microtubule associated protein 2-like [Corticium candelabrum]
MTAQTRRIDELSTSKAIPQGFLEDRRSVYWDRNIPKWRPETTNFVLSAHQEQLVCPKVLHKEYLGDRPSPIWPVSKSAQKAKSTPRLEVLSQPKATHREYEPAREIQTVVSDAAKHAGCSDRLRTLCQHKTYPNSEDELRNWDWSTWESSVPQRAKTAEPSSHTLQLAEEKKPHPQWKPSRSVQWKVSRAALNHELSETSQKLAQPKERGQQEDYNPKAWKVSSASLQAQASARLQELCLPLARKMRSKKT